MINNTVTNPIAGMWKLLLPMLVGAIIGLLIVKENVLFLGVLVGLSLFILFVRNPELPLKEMPV